MKTCAMLLAFALASTPAARGADTGPTDRLAAGVAAFTAAQRAWDLAGLLAAQPLLEQACQAQPGDATALYWKGVNEFHLALNYLTAPRTAARTAQARTRVRQAVTTLEQALALKPDDAECHALLSTLYGLRIQDQRTSAVWLGPSVMRHKRLALQHGADNARVQYLVGTSCFHAPAVAGGGLKPALDHLLKARALFEQERKAPPAPPRPAWGYDNCLAFLGRVHLAGGDRTQAAEAFNAALLENPVNGMARAGAEATREPTP